MDYDQKVCRHDPEILNKRIVAFVMTAFALACLLIVTVLYEQDLFDAQHKRAVAVQEAKADEIKWRNRFWNEIANPAADLTASPRFQGYLRFRAGITERPPVEFLVVTPAEARELIRANVVSSNELVLSTESAQIVDGMRLGRPPPEMPLPSSADLPAARDACAEMIGQPPMFWLVLWVALTFITHMSLWLFDDEPRLGSSWMNIDRVRGGYVRRAMVAILYAPVLLVIAASVALLHVPDLLMGIWRLARTLAIAVPVAALSTLVALIGAWRMGRDVAAHLFDWCREQ
jgi:hypothetical protein